MKKVVVIGGGTGISTLLKGIKTFSDEICAIVTMADDGGSSGILRKDLGILPPGDIRNCLVALANTEPIMEKLLNHRFSDGSIRGQNFGNILIAALVEIYGSFDIALSHLEEILRITGKVIPVTLKNIHLVAEFENGNKCIGESIIPNVCLSQNTRIKKIDLFPLRPIANSKATEAIEKADTIILGPGSLYTSIIPNLVVKGIIESIKKSKAQKIYIQNIMTQKGETNNYTIKDHVKAIEEHSYKGMITHCIINTKKVENEKLNKYFSKNKTTYIEIRDEDERYLIENNIKIIKGNFIEDDSEYIRHSTSKIAQTLRDEMLL